MFSRFFIDRPIFAAVLSIFIVIAGLASLRGLPIAHTPRSRRRSCRCRPIYPGASALVLEQTVAAPIENAINGVENMLYMSSTSAGNGVVQIQVTFEIGTDVNQAALNVNNRVKQAEAKLPLEVRRQGVTVVRRRRYLAAPQPERFGNGGNPGPSTAARLAGGRAHRARRGTLLPLPPAVRATRCGLGANRRIEPGVASALLAASLTPR